MKEGGRRSKISSLLLFLLLPPTRSVLDWGALYRCRFRQTEQIEYSMCQSFRLSRSGALLFWTPFGESHPPDTSERGYMHPPPPIPPAIAPWFLTQPTTLTHLYLFLLSPFKGL